MKRKKTEQNPFSLFAFQDIITSVCGIIVLVTLILTLELSFRVMSAGSSSSRRAKTEYEQAQKTIDEIKANIASAQSAVNAIQEMQENVFQNSDEIREMLEQVKEAVQRNTEKKEALETKLANVKAELEEVLPLKDETVELQEAVESAREELVQAEEDLKELQHNHSLYYKRTKDKDHIPYLVDISKTAIITQNLSISETDKNQFKKVKEFLKWVKRIEKSKYYFVLAVRPSGVEGYDEIYSELMEMGYRIGVDLVPEDQVIEIIE